MTGARQQPASQQVPLRRFIVWGAAGFGLGGMLAGLVILDLLALIVPRVQLDSGEDQSAVVSLVGCLGYGLMGVLGGAALGLAHRDGRAAFRLAVAGLLAFGLGGLANVLLAGLVHLDLSVVPPPPPGLYAGPPLTIVVLCLGAFGIRGALGGALLGLAFRARHSVRLLAVAGFLGFGLGGGLVCCFFLVPGLDRIGGAIISLGPLAGYVLWMGLCTAPGGAMLGGMVGLLFSAQKS